MRLTVALAPGEEQQLAELATREGLSIADYIRRLIQSGIQGTAPGARRQRTKTKALKRMRSWLEKARAP